MQEELWKPSDKPQGQIRIENLVKPWVEGLKALIVSNRMDPELEQRLSKKLGLDITWCVCNMRKAQSQAKAIANNKYDIVIGQTGFLSHNIETLLSKACSANQIPYIRANKARVVSLAMSLVRDLGIDLRLPPPRSEVVLTSAPPQESKDGKVRKRTVVIIPQKPDDYKDLGIDILKFLESQDSYFSLGDLFTAIPGIPVIFEADGKINWNRMRPWTNAVGKILRDLNYVNAQVPTSMDPKRPRVWIRRDKQGHLQLESVRGNTEQERTPAEVSRSQPPPRRAHQPTGYAAGSRPRQNHRTGQKWLRKYEKMIRAHARGKAYVHPEDILRMLGVNLPPTLEIVWQEHMFWTRNTAPILRKLGFTPRTREFDGRKTRVWIHKKAGRPFNMSGPGEEYIEPLDHSPAPRTKRAPAQPRQIPTSPPAAQAPTQPHVHAGGAGVEFFSAPRQTPAPAPSTGPKAARISYSSIQGGNMEELVLLLTQAGWQVSFGP